MNTYTKYKSKWVQENEERERERECYHIVLIEGSIKKKKKKKKKKKNRFGKKAQGKVENERKGKRGGGRALVVPAQSMDNVDLRHHERPACKTYPALQHLPFWRE